MIFLFAMIIKTNVIKEIFVQPVEGYTFHETSRNDSIGSDVVTRNIDSGAGNFGDFRQCHKARDQDEKIFLESLTSPVIAAAATIKGLIRIVLPVGLPCLPLKFRLLELAQS